MKIFLTTLLFVFAFEIFSQTKICEHNHGTSCYQLDTNGTFIFDYIDDTHTCFGTGSFYKTKRSITFIYDTFVSPKIHRKNVEMKRGVIEISYHHMVYGYPLMFAKIFYNQQPYYTDTTGTLLINYSGGPITIYQCYGRKDSIIVNPDIENFNKYEIYWHYGLTVEKGTIIKMKKKGDKYKYKRKVRGYNEKKDVFYPKWRTTYYIIEKK